MLLHHDNYVYIIRRNAIMNILSSRNLNIFSVVFNKDMNTNYYFSFSILLIN